MMLYICGFSRLAIPMILSRIPNGMNSTIDIMCAVSTISRTGAIRHPMLSFPKIAFIFLCGAFYRTAGVCAMGKMVVQIT